MRCLPTELMLILTLTKLDMVFKPESPATDAMTMSVFFVA
jgi:hypothetical protein